MKPYAHLALAIAGVILFATGQADAESISIDGGARSFHAPTNKRSVEALEDVLTSDNGYTSAGICKAINVPWCGAWLRAADIGLNAAMVSRPADQDATDTHYELLYGADLARQYPDLYGIVLAHEIGHQWCGHLNGFKIAPWDAELEADAFAGAVMRTFHNTWGDEFPEFSVTSVAGALALMDGRPSASHPTRDLRIRALMDGYRNPRDTISKCWDRPHGNRVGGPDTWDYHYSVELEAKGLASWRSGWATNWSD